jgi:heme exporter protein B
MFKSLFVMIQQEIRTTMRQAFSWITPLLFFVMIVCLFPLALGSDENLLNQVAPSIIWVAALLAILMSIGNLFHQDAEEGHLDALLLCPYPLTFIVLCKILCHWVTHCLPLILISPMLGLLLHLRADQETALIITLLLGTPVFSLWGAIGAALIVGIRSHGLLLPILIMPLYIPILIFGTGTLMAVSTHQPVAGYYAIMGALNLISFASAPFLASAALRIGVNQ